MFAAAVARVIEHRRWRSPAAKRPIVTDVNPASRESGLGLGQYRHGRVVAVQPLGGKDMRLDPRDQRRQHRAARADHRRLLPVDCQYWQRRKSGAWSDAGPSFPLVGEAAVLEVEPEPLNSPHHFCRERRRSSLWLTLILSSPIASPLKRRPSPEGDGSRPVSSPHHPNIARGSDHVNFFSARITAAIVDARAQLLKRRLKSRHNRIPIPIHDRNPHRSALEPKVPRNTAYPKGEIGRFKGNGRIRHLACGSDQGFGYGQKRTSSAP